MMLSPDDQRRLLGAFLRQRREQLRAGDVGLAASGAGRRRTPGLRREEVAQIAGSARPGTPGSSRAATFPSPPSALARLAEAMQLSPAERAYLFQLTRKRDPLEPTAGARGKPSAGDLARRRRGHRRARLSSRSALARQSMEQPGGRALRRLARRATSPACSLMSSSTPARAPSSPIGQIARDALSPSFAPTPAAIPTIPRLRALVERLRPAARNLPLSGAITRFWRAKAARAPSIILATARSPMSRSPCRRPAGPITNWSCC